MYIILATHDFGIVTKKAPSTCVNVYQKPLCVYTIEEKKKKIAPVIQRGRYSIQVPALNRPSRTMS